MQRSSPVVPTGQDRGTYLDTVTAPQPLGFFGSYDPGSSDDSRKKRRRIDTFSSPENEHARSAVLLQFPCEQYHTGMTKWTHNLWKNPTCQDSTNQSEYTSKQVPCPHDSYSRRKLNVRTSWLDTKRMVSPMQWTLPSAAPINIIVRQSKSFEDGVIGKQFAPF